MQVETRETVKTLVKELAEKRPRDKYSWDQVRLDRQEEACNEVNETLVGQKIASVDPTKIAQRLWKAVLDMQRSKPRRYRSSGRG